MINNSKFLYILKFSNGFIKIGVSGLVDRRIKNHVSEMKKINAYIEKRWVSIEHYNYSSNENTLKELTKNSRLKFTKEWSTNENFDDLVAKANKFEFIVTLTKKQIENSNALIKMCSSAGHLSKVKTTPINTGNVFNINMADAADIVYVVSQGLTKKEFREFHGLKDCVAIRSTLTDLEILCLNDLDCLNTDMIKDGINYSDRESNLESRYFDKHSRGLIDEVKRLEY